MKNKYKVYCIISALYTGMCVVDIILMFILSSISITNIICLILMAIMGGMATYKSYIEAKIIHYEIKADIDENGDFKIISADGSDIAKKLKNTNIIELLKKSKEHLSIDDIEGVINFLDSVKSELTTIRDEKSAENKNDGGNQDEIK